MVMGNRWPICTQEWILSDIFSVITNLKAANVFPVFVADCVVFMAGDTFAAGNA